MSSPALLERFVATLVLTSALAVRGSAQCAIPDGLDAGLTTCSGAFTQVPQAMFAQPALGICWKDCGVDATAPYRAQWGTLTPVSISTSPVPSCGWYTSALILRQGGSPRWVGGMHLSYSRTWTEFGSPTVYQVWRFLVNGDLRMVSTTPGPCAVPACVPPNGGRMRVTGYIDYAMNCSVVGAPFEHSWMLTHGCDGVDHVAGFPRAGSYHSNRFYTFLGPRAGFVVGAGSTLENGASAVECIRKWDASALPARCNEEEPLLFANFNPSSNLCLCGTGPGLWYEAFFNAVGSWGSIVSPFGGSDPFRSYPIGSWTNPNVFPGVEEVRYNTNELDYLDCTGFSRQEYYFGVTTAGGFPAFTISAITPPVPLPLTFIDQSNSVILPIGVATRNQPYRSDHILNLNL